MEALQQALHGLAADERLTRALALPQTRRCVSAVMATYNRCPVDPERHGMRDNPLTWALDSLLAQAGDALAEIVVVDDGSTDHTQRVLARYEAGGGSVPVRVLRLKQHLGAWAARNAAASAARSPWLLFGDDDCVFSAHYAAGAAYALDQTRRHDPRTAAVNLPFYYRAVGPREVMAETAIGRLRPEMAEFATWFHAWPDTYVPRPPMLDERSGLVAPLRVELIGGTALIVKEALQRAGGFVDLSSWPTSYSDHLHLSADLTQTGARLYHCPDPRLSAVHLKYGAIGRYPSTPTDLDLALQTVGRTLGELVSLSETPRTDTGCRVAEDVFHADMIGSFFAFFAGRSIDGGVRWALRMWQDFVQLGHVYSRAIATVPSPDERHRAWRDGLTRGAQWLASPQARPARTPGELDIVLARICQQTGERPIIWRTPP